MTQSQVLNSTGTEESGTVTVLSSLWGLGKTRMVWRRISAPCRKTSSALAVLVSSNTTPSPQKAAHKKSEVP